VVHGYTSPAEFFRSSPNWYWSVFSGAILAYLVAWWYRKQLFAYWIAYVAGMVSTAAVIAHLVLVTRGK